jgi:predicted DNA-binding ribbon-helix-helix protein
MCPNGDTSDTKSTMPDIRMIPKRVRVATAAAARERLIVLSLAAAIREEAAMNSSVKKRSIVIGSHKTSISLEDKFWVCLRQIARERATTVSKIIGILDAERNGGNLSSTIRVFVLNRYRTSVAPNQILTAEAGRNSAVIDISLAD